MESNTPTSRVLLLLLGELPVIWALKAPLLTENSRDTAHTDPSLDLSVFLPPRIQVPGKECPGALLHVITQYGHFPGFLVTALSTTFRVCVYWYCVLTVASCAIRPKDLDMRSFPKLRAVLLVRCAVNHSPNLLNLTALPKKTS